MIVWDLGGVVAEFRPEVRLAALVNATGLAGPVIDDAIWGSGLDAAAERGDLTEAEVWARTLAALEHRIDETTLRRCWAEAFVPNAAVLELIDRRGERAALFTDNGPILEACLHHELRAIGDRFDPILLTWRLGATKSDDAAFERAADALAQDPAALVLVDDKFANVDRARRAGWSAVHAPSTADLEVRLPPPT